MRITGNLKNHGGHRGSSNYHGVWLDKRNGNWRAMECDVCGGTYTTELAAAIAVDLIRRELGLPPINSPHLLHRWEEIEAFRAPRCHSVAKIKEKCRRARLELERQTVQCTKPVVAPPKPTQPVQEPTSGWRWLTTRIGLPWPWKEASR